MERAPGATSDRLHVGADASNKIYGIGSPTQRGGGNGQYVEEAEEHYENDHYEDDHYEDDGAYDDERSP